MCESSNKNNLNWKFRLFTNKNNRSSGKLQTNIYGKEELQKAEVYGNVLLITSAWGAPCGHLAEKQCVQSTNNTVHSSQTSAVLTRAQSQKTANNIWLSINQEFKDMWGFCQGLVCSLDNLHLVLRNHRMQMTLDGDHMRNLRLY